MKTGKTIFISNRVEKALTPRRAYKSKSDSYYKNLSHTQETCTGDKRGVRTAYK